MIVYNERGHRIEDDDIDVYPEDDVSSQHNSSRNNANGRSSSRSHTPVDPYYPPSSSNSRRTSNAVIPDVTRIDARTTEVSKGYTPSAAPSARSATYRGSDGERTSSDPGRKKGKERYTDDEKDRDRGMPGGPSPIEKTTSAGPGSIAKASSIHSAVGGGEMLSSNWNPPPSASSSRSPSKQPHSRTQSIHTGHGDHSPVHDFQRPPSIVDQRQDHPLDNSAPSFLPQSAVMDATLDRPRSAYGQVGYQSRSHTPYGGSRPRTPAEPPVPSKTPGITRSNTPFIDRPKSGAESSFFDRPKSAFGGGSIYGDSGEAMFGDSGPAADIGAGVGTPLFGDPPASVFGDTPASMFGDTHGNESGGAHDGWGSIGGEQARDDWGNEKGEETGANSWGEAGYEGGVVDNFSTPEGGADDNWNIPVVTTVAAEEPPATPITTPSTAKKTSKRKNSAAISTPASGLASRASPALSTRQSLIENTGDAGFYDDPTAASSFMAAGTPSISRAPSVSAGGGLWGSKAPSPKPLSPLNPASQMDNDPLATLQDELNLRLDTSGGAGTVAGGEAEKSNEPDVSLGDNNPTKPSTQAPSPIPPTSEELTAVEKEPVTAGKPKKKKKGSTATTPAKSPHMLTQEAAEKEKEEERIRAEKAEQERLAAEAEAAANDARLQKEQEEKERENQRLEQERLEQERKEQEAAQAEHERLEQERLEQERKEQEAAQAEHERLEQARLEQERKEQEAAQAEHERLERERLEQERKEKEAAQAEHERLERERLEQERKEQAAAQAEQERLEQERKEQERLKQEQEAAEKERAEQERLEQEARDETAAAPVSAFGSDPPTLFSGGIFSSPLESPDKPWMTDAGGGEDSWNNSGWGTPTSGKKKKTKLGGISSRNSTFGAVASVFGETTPIATTPLAAELSSSQDAGAELFSFSSSTPNLSFGFGDTKPTAEPTSAADEPAPAANEPTPVADEPVPAANEPPSVADEPAPTANEPTPVADESAAAVDEPTSTPVEIEASPTDAISPAAENDAAGEEEGFGFSATNKKKKKKKGAAGAATETKEDVPETPVLGDEPAQGGGKKKKKKK